MIIKIGISVVSVCASIGIGYTWCYNVMKRQVQRLSKSNSENNIAHNKQLREKNDELIELKKEYKNAVAMNKELKNLSQQVVDEGKELRKKLDVEVEKIRNIKQENRILRTHNELLEAYKKNHKFYMVRSKPSKQRRQIVRKVGKQCST